MTRQVSVRGAIMIGRQKIQVGLAHARKTIEVTVEADTHQVSVEPGIIITAARTTSRDIRRHKAWAGSHSRSTAVWHQGFAPSQTGTKGRLPKRAPRPP